MTTIEVNGGTIAYELFAPALYSPGMLVVVRPA